MLSLLSIKRPVTTVMVMLIVALVGIFAYSTLELNLMPEVDIPIAIVSTTYDGAGPEEIENLITKTIEAALGSVSNVKNITSTSSSGSSIVIVEFVDGTDVDMAAIDVREGIDRIASFLPDDASDPMVLKLDINAASINIGVSSETLSKTSMNTLIEDSIVTQFERIEGVSSVSISGDAEEEIEIILKPEKMVNYGISTAAVSSTLRAENINLPAGEVTQGDSALQLRTMGEFQSVDDIRNLPLTTRGGSILYLKDIADVNLIEKEITSYAIIDGKDGVILSIDKQSTMNLVEVTDLLVAEMTKLENEYPDLGFTLLTNTAEFIKLSVNNVIKTALQSALLAMIILFIFLRDIKASVVIGISIPVSIAATFCLMYFNNMTLNTITLGAITIGIGMLVDNSVVVLENIYKYWQTGMSPKEASKVGASEVGMAVSASTLTTVAVFVPMLFITGSIGQVFKDMAYTICFALISSLFVSLSFVPMACSKILSASENRAAKEDTNIFAKMLTAWGKLLDTLDNGYKKVLVWSLANKKATIAIVLACFFATLYITPLAGFDFMPSVDEGTATIHIEMPSGTSLDDTMTLTYKVLDIIEAAVPEKDFISTIVGGGGGFNSASTDVSNITIKLVEQAERSRSTDEVVEQLKVDLEGIAGAEITVATSGTAMGSFSGAQLSLEIAGDNIDILDEISSDVEDMIASIIGSKDITNSLGDSIPEAKIVVDRQKASAYGVNTASINSIINTAVAGSTVSQYKVDGTELDIVLRHNSDDVNYINDISGIIIETGIGANIPLSEIATITIENAPASISRENNTRYVTVSANNDNLDTSSFQKQVVALLEAYDMPAGYTYSFGGDFESMIDAFTSLFTALVVAVLLVYMIMASQFESLIYPFIIMFSMPIALTGGILGLIITGETITANSFMGFIMLVGMVVNNAIVLVDYANQLMDNKGMSAVEALTEAGPNRLRPILMTTLTTILGLLPMALGIGEGMESLASLGITVVYGLSISTVITLVFIPVLYAVLDKLRLRNKRRKKLAEASI